ncbi:MAG: trehalase family glycosidase [Bacteroidota bacterium]
MRVLLLVLFSCCLSLLQAQNVPASYQEVKEDLLQGWNTWSTYSMGQHVLLPHGFSINLGLLKRSKNSDGFVNRFFVDKTANGWKKPIVKPGYHTYSGDYTSLEIEYRKVKFHLETAAYGEEFFMLITPLEIDPEYPLVCLFEAGVNWNFPGKISSDNKVLKYEKEGKEIMIYPSQTPLDDPYFDSYSPFLALELNQEIGISTVYNDIEVIKQKIKDKRTAYQKQITQYGDLAESYAGMSSCLAWNTIFDPKRKRVFSTVDRGWNKSRGGYVFFGWDNFFMSQMIGLDEPNLAMANAIEALNEVTEEGFVSNNSQANGRKSWDRSQPPVGSMMCWEIYEKHPRKWFLEEIYPKLIRWNDWWMEKRMNGKLLSWGSHVSKNPFHDSRYNTLKAAMLETGIDDSPMYEGVGFDAEKGMMELHDVGLNAMYIGDCEALIKMAEALGKKEDMKRLKNRSKDLKKQIQALWNKENDLFQNYDLINECYVDRISPTSFYPLIGKTASGDQAKKMIERHMLNEEEFWGEWALPSVSKTDPFYEKQRYWRGAIWAPMNFLVYLGMKDYEELRSVRKQLVEKSVQVFEKNWLGNGFVCENYSPIDGTCTHEKLTSSPWYTWGGMMAIIGLMEAGYYNQN